MEITQNVQGASTAASATQTAQPVISSDFETFLTMLTVQMENQDPLNPVESTEFATQLATFSSVEQQVLTNDLLTAMNAQLGATSVSQLSGWVGMNARAAMPVNYTGDPTTIVTEAAQFADTAQLVAHNSNGAEVARYDITTTRSEFEWQALDQDGGPLPTGEYTLSVESFSGDELIAKSAVLVEARIIEARIENGQSVLVMDTGQEVASTNIVGLREAS